MNDNLYYRSLGYEGASDYKIKNVYSYNVFGWFYCADLDEVYLVHRRFGQLCDFGDYMNVDTSSYESVHNSIYNYVIEKLHKYLESNIMFGELYINDNHYTISEYVDSLLLAPDYYINKYLKSKRMDETFGVFGDCYNAPYYLTILNNHPSKYTNMRKVMKAILEKRKYAKFIVCDRLNSSIECHDIDIPEDERLSYIKSDCIYLSNAAYGLDMCFPYDNEDTPGKTMSEYRDIIYRGGTIIDENNNKFNIPTEDSSVWLNISVTTLCSGKEINWINLVNKHLMKKGIIRYIPMCDQYGRCRKYDIVTKTYSPICINHTDGKFRMTIDGKSADVSDVVRQTFEQAGLLHLVPNELYCDRKYFVKAPYKLSNPNKINIKSFVVYKDCIFNNRASLHLALYNEPQRSDKCCDCVKLVDYFKGSISIDELSDVILNLYRENYASLESSLKDKFMNSDLVDEFDEETN